MLNSHSDDAAPQPNWTLITSHGLVLLYIAANQDATIRQIADDLEFSERRVADVIRDLATAGLINVEHRGRRNYYNLSPNARFRHPFVADIPFEEFLGLWRNKRAKPEARLTGEEPPAAQPNMRSG